MQKIARSTLLLCAAVTIVAGFALSAGPLGTVPPIGWGWVTLLVVAAVDGVLAWRIRSAISEGGIGQDRRQMHPVSVARALALGQASAVLGALAGGAGVGLTLYCLAYLDTISAAATELPFALGVAASGSALVIAGLILEASCELPPDEEDQATSPLTA